MVKQNGNRQKYGVKFEYAFIRALLISYVTSEPRNVAIIQDIDTVSIEKGVDIITTKHEKSHYEHSKESHDLQPKLQQEYSEASREIISSSNEHPDNIGIVTYNDKQLGIYVIKFLQFVCIHVFLLLKIMKYLMEFISPLRKTAGENLHKGLED